jgi:DnaJ like chaperone protein
MSIWIRIATALSALTSGQGLREVFDSLRAPPERSVAFTIAVIALGAKMAKADGLVTRNEVAAFREVFVIPPEEELNAARVFNLARQDVTGFEEYARRIKSMFGDQCDVLIDLLEGLFHIAVADGEFHPAEEEFLHRVAQIFDVTEKKFRAVRARYVPDTDPDPWEVLGIAHGVPVEEARSAWRQLVRESHPDRMIARGVPEEGIKMAEKRLIAINRAWEEINTGRAA